MIHHTLQVRSLEEYKQYETALWKAFPDWHETILDMVAEGDKAWLFGEVTATHTGELRVPFLPQINKKVRVAPTGKKIKFTYIGMYRIVDGKIVDIRSVHAIMEAYKDLGIIEHKELPEDVS